MLSLARAVAREACILPNKGRISKDCVYNRSRVRQPIYNEYIPFKHIAALIL